MSYATVRKRTTNSDINKLATEDQGVHQWYRFVLSFPPHLVRDYLTRWGIDETQRVLDPFCGTGTVLAECKKLGIPSIGIEANPFACFASRTKVNWSPNPDGLLEHAHMVAADALAQLTNDGVEDAPLFGGLFGGSPNVRTLPDEIMALLLEGSISPLPLHKALVLLECLEHHRDDRYYAHERLALATALVYSSSNLRFGPEVGVGRPRPDAAVIAPWLTNIQSMVSDLRSVGGLAGTPSEVYLGDSRQMLTMLRSASVDVVFTSPPYPNEKDYTRTTRLESVLLGFVRSKSDLRALKQNLLRSNTRNVYKGDTDEWDVGAHWEIQDIADAIENERIRRGKTSGFERLYSAVTRHYFGGMAQHLAQLRAILRPGAYLAYVVGDQASYLQVMIRTGRLLSEIGQMLGYEWLGTELFRTRLATATKAQLNEEVVLFRFAPDADTLARRYASLPLGIHGSPERDYLMADSGDHQLTANRYQQIMEAIFFAHYQQGVDEVDFKREELADAARQLGITTPLNLGDIPYSFRFRQPLPERILATAPEDKEWIIRSVGRSQYRFVLTDKVDLSPTKGLAQTKIPDATPGIVTMYAQNDEQGLLAKVRYNRLIDIFTGVTCYSLQNHLRTTVPNIGQVETDELYVGIDKRGVHYVFPVQAKAGRDKIGRSQIEQDLALCKDRYPQLIARAIAVQFMRDDAIALKAFELRDEKLVIVAEKHYLLTLPDKIEPGDLEQYHKRPED